MDSYSEKEERTFRSELFRRLDDQDDELNEIKVQTLKTNGRVNKHDWYFTSLWWAIGLIGAFIAYTAPTVVKFVSTINRMNHQLTQLQNEKR